MSCVSHYSPAVLPVLLYCIICPLNLTGNPGFALLYYTHRAQLEVGHVCFILKIQTSYYKSSGQPGAALVKPLGGVCELSQPQCGYSSAGPV